MRLMYVVVLNKWESEAYVRSSAYERRALKHKYRCTLGLVGGTPVHMESHEGEDLERAKRW